MKRSAIRERGREIGPGDPCCVWRLGVILGHDPPPWNLMARHQWAPGCYWSIFLSQESVIPWCPQDPGRFQNKQLTCLFMEMLRDSGTKQALRSLWVSPDLSPSRLSPKQPFVSYPESFPFLSTRHLPWHPWMQYLSTPGSFVPWHKLVFLPRRVPSPLKSKFFLILQIPA